MDMENVISTSSSENDSEFDFLKIPSNVDEIEVSADKEVTEQEWMDIIGSGDLKKKIIKAGIIESRPSKGDTVIIEFQSSCEDGRIIHEKHEKTFTLGDCEVIQGLELVLPLMDRDEESEVYMAPRFAYGSKGDVKLNVNPDETLIAIVKLIEFTPETSPLDLPVEERQGIGNRKRQCGNWWFSREDFSEAVQCYKAAVDYLDHAETSIGDQISSSVHSLFEDRLRAQNNMAAAQIKLCAFEPALNTLRCVLDCQPDNIKALYRKGKALSELGRTDEALEPLQKALLLDPTNKTILNFVSQISQKIKTEAESEKTLYRKMLGLKKPKNSNKDSRSLSSDPWKTFLTTFTTLLAVGVAYVYREQLQVQFKALIPS